MLERIWIIFHKEVIDNLRDRRSIANSLMASLFVPLLMIGMFALIGRTSSEKAEQPLQLAVSGAAHAPGLIEFLKESDVEIQPAPADSEAEIREGNVDVVLIIPESYGGDFHAERPATVQLMFDDSRGQAVQISIQRAQDLLSRYSQRIGDARLREQGIDPSVIQVLAIEGKNLATPQSQAANILNMLPYILVFSVFMGGMYVATDATAGERERGSLEPLLINPVARQELVLGKLGATLLFTVVAVIVSLVSLVVLLKLVPLEEMLDMEIRFSLTALLAFLLLSLPMAAMASALQMVIATFARSYKEATTYLGFLALVPVVPALFLMVAPVKAQLWLMLIPTVGQQLLMNQIMRGESLDAFNVVVASGVTLLIGLALVFVAIKLYHRERVLFGR